MEILQLDTLWILALVAFIAGYIDAIAGGGGMLTVPALLSTGLPPHVVLGTNKLAASFGSATAAFTYFRKKLFSPVFWWRSFIATLIGAIIGTLLVDYISTTWLEKILPLFIFASALYTLCHSQPKSVKSELPEKDTKLKKKQWGQGLSLGFYDGVLGPGTGAFWTVSNMSLYKINMLISSGVAKAMNFTSNFASLITFILLGHVNWTVGLTMGICLMVGSYLGAHSAIKFGIKFIKPVFITVVLVLTSKLVWNAWF